MSTKSCLTIDAIPSSCAALRPSTVRSMDVESANIDDPKALLERLRALEERVETLEAAQPKNGVTVSVTSGSFDRLYTAFAVAAGAAATGVSVHMYFGFWGLAAVRRRSAFAGKSISEAMISAMIARGPDRTGLSKFNFGGLGRNIFQRIMRREGMTTLPELVETCRELGVRFFVCQLSMEMLGLRREELLEGVEFVGAGTYVGSALDSRSTIFI
jgi:peroxiredoxin family protein